MKAALYLRVSTKEGTGRQTTDNQRRDLQAYAQRKGWTIVETYEDHESGGKGRGERKAFDRMFKDARKGVFDVVLFWSLDRFSRQGIYMTLHYLQALNDAGVAFASYTEEILNTENELVRSIVIAVLSAIAEYERKRIGERTRSGLRRAREQGKKLGRPNLVNAKSEAVLGMVAEGKNTDDILRATGISRRTFYRICQNARDDHQGT